ncbi:MAG: type II toxin-antitoxin system VapC family toxin [Candidatus Dormibacteria bacterium]
MCARRCRSECVACSSICTPTQNCGAVHPVPKGADPAAARVDEALKGRPVMSWINLGEVFYIVHRVAGEGRAQHTVRDLRQRLQLDLPDPARVLEAATIKAKHQLAHADAFAVATALAHRAEPMTGEPEILAHGDPAWPTIDLR